MTEPANTKTPQNKERDQKPLWYAIGGLVISLFSFSMQDQQISVVVFWFGAVFAVIAIIYWLVQPTHGVSSKK